MLLLEFSMTPAGQGESYTASVARILDLIDRSGVPYRLTPMGTILEGEWAAVMKVVGDCFALLAADFDRVGAQIKLDWRRGGESRLASKIESVEQRLGRKLST